MYSYVCKSAALVATSIALHLWFSFSVAPYYIAPDYGNTSTKGFEHFYSLRAESE